MSLECLAYMSAQVFGFNSRMTQNNKEEMIWNAKLHFIVDTPCFRASDVNRDHKQEQLIKISRGELQKPSGYSHCS